jgi:hypothetical protein
MNRPKIFISTVSDEFGQIRQTIAQKLRQIGYTPVYQNEFPTGHGNLLQWLRQQIKPCAGIIQLVGDAYGREPPHPIPEFGKISYTQFELLHAAKRGLITWVFFASPEFPKDTPLHLLDPPAPDHPEPTAFQAQCRSAQTLYRARIREMNLIRHNVHSTQQLLDLLDHIRDHDAELTARMDARWRRIKASIAAILIALVAIGGGTWWALNHLSSSIKSGALTPAQIREQLLAAEQNHHKTQLKNLVSKLDGSPDDPNAALTTIIHTFGKPAPPSGHEIWDLPQLSQLASTITKSLASEEGYNQFHESGAAESLLKLFPQSQDPPPAFTFPLSLLEAWRCQPSQWLSRIEKLISSCASDTEKQKSATAALHHLTQMVECTPQSETLPPPGFSSEEILKAAPLLTGAIPWLGDQPILRCASAFPELSKERESILISAATAGSVTAKSTAASAIFLRVATLNPQNLPLEESRLLAQALVWIDQYPPDLASELEPAIRVLISEPFWTMEVGTQIGSARRELALRLSNLPALNENHILRGDIHTARAARLPVGSPDAIKAFGSAADFYLLARNHRIPGAAYRAYNTLLSKHGGFPANHPDSRLILELALESADWLDGQGERELAAKLRQAANENMK